MSTENYKNQNEIGSEFWSVPISKEDNNLFSANTQWFLSGRIALEGIIKDNDFNTVALPSWCCDSMIIPFLKNGIRVSIYPVYFDGALVQDLSAVDADAVLVMDYFGYTGQSELKGYNGTIIRDVTHSIFSATYNDASYYFGSLRKWAGFWTGGYAWGVKFDEKTNKKTNEKYVKLRKFAMNAKAKYISGASDNNDYIKFFNEAEQCLDYCGVTAADHRDMQLAQKLDIEGIRTQRQRNAKVLIEQLNDIAIFPVIKDIDCPMFVPILVPFGKRNELRRYLIERKIYCPVHWPISQYHKLDEKTRTIYYDELSLVCDQRYTEEDMGRIISTIKEFWKGV